MPFPYLKLVNKRGEFIRLRIEANLAVKDGQTGKWEPNKVHFKAYLTDPSDAGETSLRMQALGSFANSPQSEDPDEWITAYISYPLSGDYKSHLYKLHNVIMAIPDSYELNNGEVKLACDSYVVIDTNPNPEIPSGWKGLLVRLLLRVKEQLCH